MVAGDTVSGTPQRFRARVGDLLFLLTLSAALFLPGLGDRDLWNPNEPIYGLAVAEMAERGDWTIPTVNGRVFAEKPILYYWLARAASVLTGRIDELSLRIPSVLAATGAVLLTYTIVVAYAGRRRALISSVVLATSYQVFWAGRAVQMDVLILLSTAGVIAPIVRRLDHGLRPELAWGMAGLAAGLGFSAKGPVALVLPGAVILGYVLATRRVRLLLEKPALIGVCTALAAGSPWFVDLLLSGESEVLYEVLWRQNFHRFVDAWDHQRPWWYYFPYLVSDYAPWSWLLPASLFVSPRGEGERRLQQLGWVWIAAILFFFSLSESKRAPYILPLAPAIAILTSAVVDRWLVGWHDRERRGGSVLASMALFLLAVVFVAAGSTMVGLRELSLLSMNQVGALLGTILITGGVVTGSGVFLRVRYPWLAPAGVLASAVILFSTAAVILLPSANQLKSARSFASEMNSVAGGEEVVSYGFWSWRSGYSYYGDRRIANLETEKELLEYWTNRRSPFVLVEDETVYEIASVIPSVAIVEEGEIGSRRVYLLSRRGNDLTAESQGFNDEISRPPVGESKSAAVADAETARKHGP